ncbi:hypothetical protein L570_2246 [Bordetella pertussis 2356847]|nr:hypothetical protein L570_2246 [Bordetella pertussis 2356847]
MRPHPLDGRGDDTADIYQMTHGQSPRPQPPACTSRRGPAAPPALRNSAA